MEVSMSSDGSWSDTEGGDVDKDIARQVSDAPVSLTQTVFSQCHCHRNSLMSVSVSCQCHCHTNSLLSVSVSCH